MDEKLRERIGELLEAAGQAGGEDAFVPLATLDSGARLGLNADATWVATGPEGQGLYAFAPGAEKWFYEAVENPRTEFEQLLEQGARDAGFDDDSVACSFPSVELVAAVLGTHSTYFTRLALRWLLPSELRPLRQQILAVAENNNLPRSIRELAKRLIVPE